MTPPSAAGAVERRHHMEARQQTCQGLCVCVSSCREAFCSIAHRRCELFPDGSAEFPATYRAATGSASYALARDAARRLLIQPDMLPSLLARVSFTVLATTLSLTTAQGQSKQQTPPLAIESLTGRDSFDVYCASCHGATGAGNGPVAAALRTKPADLSAVSRRNGGTFPRERVAAFIEGAGRPVPAHGSGDMPVWGTIFRGLDPSDARTRVRLANLVAYVESLQVTLVAAGAVSPLSGPELFRRYCASCHGGSGRGDGPMAGELRRSPPDLTRFSARNGGVFPSERVRRIIDGREVGAHGDRSMPVWGDVFKRQKDADDQTVAARLDALVAFLQALQERPAE